jgi:histidinol-phosphate aminotransferase
MEFNRYPERAAAGLTATLSRFLGVPGECIILGSGSDELIQMLALAVGPGRRAVIPAPTFSMYRHSVRLTGSVPVEVPLNEDFSLDAEKVLAAAGAEPD